MKKEAGKRSKQALIVPTGVEIGRDGKPKVVQVAVVGDTEAVQAAEGFLKSVIGEENVVRDEGVGRSSWGGFGKGKMDAKRGGRTKIILGKSRGTDAKIQ